MVLLGLSGGLVFLLASGAFVFFDDFEMMGVGTGDPVGVPVGDAVGDPVGGPVGGPVGDPVGDPVGSRVAEIRLEKVKLVLEEL